MLRCMGLFRSIVVGADFSECSTVAIRQTLRMAAWPGPTTTRIHAVHVVDALVVEELAEATGQADVRGRVQRDAEDAWRQLRGGIPGAENLPLEVVVDDRIRGILERARANAAELVVMGAYGSRMPDVGGGTVATACVREAGMDVMLVRDTRPGGGSHPFRMVVVGVDFSPTSQVALERAAEVAACDGAELCVLHVFEGPWHKLHYKSFTTEADPAFQRQYRDALQRRLEDFARPAIERHRVARHAVQVFDHAGHRTGLVTWAEKAGADLICVGTRGRTNLRDLLLGSTAERVLGESSCSVLAVKPRRPVD
ncbi:MAG: hypothetical protein RLZZ558_288 [Planctomycetota bacterium]